MRSWLKENQSGVAYSAALLLIGALLGAESVREFEHRKRVRALAACRDGLLEINDRLDRLERKGKYSGLRVKQNTASFDE